MRQAPWIRLPAFTYERRVPVMVTTHLVILAWFWAALHHPLARPLSLAGWFGVDDRIPFVPASIVVYLTHYAFVFASLWFLREALNMNRVNASIALCASAAILVFLVQPTDIPRQELRGVARPFRDLFRALYRVEDPHANCFPSLHCALAYLCALGYRDEQRRWYPAALFWAAAIAVSTVTTKQHYLVDVPAGLALAWASRWIVDHRVEFVFPGAAARAPAAEVARRQ